MAAYVGDPANDTEWIGGISRAEKLTDGPVREGTRVERTASFIGRSFDYTLEVVEQLPGERLAMKSVAGPFPMDVAYELEDADEGTLMRIRVSGEAGRFYRIAGPLLARGVRRNLRRDLQRLADVLTTRDAATPGARRA